MVSPAQHHHFLSQPRMTFASSSIPLYQLCFQDATTVQHWVYKSLSGASQTAALRKAPVVMASPLSQAAWGPAPLSQHMCCSPSQALKKAKLGASLVDQHMHSRYDHASKTDGLRISPTHQCIHCSDNWTS